MKRYSVSLVIRKTQIKTTRRHHITPTKKAIILKRQLSLGTFLVAQWLRIRLPMQGTWVQALVREDPTCRRATKPMHHNY